MPQASGNWRRTSICRCVSLREVGQAGRSSHTHTYTHYTHIHTHTHACTHMHTPTHTCTHASRTPRGISIHTYTNTHTFYTYIQKTTNVHVIALGGHGDWDSRGWTPHDERPCVGGTANDPRLGQQCVVIRVGSWTQAWSHRSSFVRVCEQFHQYECVSSPGTSQSQCVRAAPLVRVIVSV